MPRVPSARAAEADSSSPKARPMAASTCSFGSGAGASVSGLVSATTLVASPRLGRSAASVQPKPRVNQAFWVDSANRICDVLEPPGLVDVAGQERHERVVRQVGVRVVPVGDEGDGAGVVRGVAGARLEQRVGRRSTRRRAAATSRTRSTATMRRTRRMGGRYRPRPGTGPHSDAVARPGRSGGGPVGRQVVVTAGRRAAGRGCRAGSARPASG